MVVGNMPTTIVKAWQSCLPKVTVFLELSQYVGRMLEFPDEPVKL